MLSKTLVMPTTLQEKITLSVHRISARAYRVQKCEFEAQLFQKLKEYGVLFLSLSQVIFESQVAAMGLGQHCQFFNTFQIVPSLFFI